MGAGKGSTSCQAARSSGMSSPGTQVRIKLLIFLLASFIRSSNCSPTKGNHGKMIYLNGTLERLEFQSTTAPFTLGRINWLSILSRINGGKNVNQASYNLTAGCGSSGGHSLLIADLTFGSQTFQRRLSNGVIGASL